MRPIPTLFLDGQIHQEWIGFCKTSEVGWGDVLDDFIAIVLGNPISVQQHHDVAAAGGGSVRAYLRRRIIVVRASDAARRGSEDMPEGRRIARHWHWHTCTPSAAGTAQRCWVESGY